MNRWRRKIRYYLVLIIVLAFVAGSLIWYYYPIWTAGQVEYILARPGTIEYKTRVKASFANEEYPIYAPASGKLTLSANSKQRYRRGEVIGTIQADPETPVVIEEGGLFYNFIDGLEKVFSRDNLVNMELNSLLAQKGKVTPTPAAVTSGSPVGKIVNNHQATAAFFELPSTEGLQMEDIKVKQKLKFEVGNRGYEAIVLKKSSQPRGIVVEFESFVEGSVENRIKEVVWNYKSSPEGILLPKNSLWVKGEEKGVFVVAEGVIRFRRVKILDQNETTVSVEGVPSAMIVITTPREGLEGISWNGNNP